MHYNMVCFFTTYNNDLPGIGFYLFKLKHVQVSFVAFTRYKLTHGYNFSSDESSFCSYMLSCLNLAILSKLTSS